MHFLYYFAGFNVRCTSKQNTQRQIATIVSLVAIGISISAGLYLLKKINQSKLSRVSKRLLNASTLFVSVILVPVIILIAASFSAPWCNS